MSEIKAVFSKMQNAAQEESSLSRELNQMESEISNILSSLAIKSSAADNIRRSLRSSMQNVSDAKSKLNILSSTLSDIVRLYQSAENAITDGIKAESVKDETNSLIQNAWNKIKDIAKRYGMDPSIAYSKDPVNLSNGNYVYEKVCMELDTEMAMQFRIFYNIQNETSGSLGRGWTHTWEVSLERSEGRISMIQDDASRYIFLEEEGEYRPALGTTAVLKHQEGFIVVTDRNGISYYFESSGRLMRMENLSGCNITLEYDQKNCLARVVDRRGNFFQFKYNGKGNLQTVEDSAGRKVTMIWDGGRLSMVLDPMGRQTEYRYDAHGWLTELVNGRGVTCLVNTYDDQGRTLNQKFPDGGVINYDYLDEESQIVLTEQNGNKIIYEHDEFLCNTRTIYTDGEEVKTFDENHNCTSMTDKRGNTSHFSYDASGNMLSFRNAVDDELTFSYTDKNQVSQIKLNGAMVHQAVYDERNLQIQTENSEGAVNRYEYDEYGQPILWERADGSKIKLTYDDMGNLSSITNAAGGCTQYLYNDRNQVVKTIDPLGNETLYTYNDSDELTSVQDAMGNIQSYDYDECGNVIRMTDASGAETVTEYNGMNKPVRITTQDGSETLYEYDTMWNVVSITAPDGGKIRYEYDQLHHLIAVTDANGGINRLKYDACGNLVRRIDPDGGVYQLGYDVLNRPNYICDPVGMEVQAEYDALGNVTAVLYSDGSAEHYEYDLTGHMTMAQNRDGYQKFYEYDILGNLKTVSDVTGILEQYTYYPGGLLETERYIDGSGRTLYYDSNENVVKIVNQDGNQWKFDYDSLGRVIRACQDNGLEESYEYDALGNVTAVIDGNGVKTGYHYNGTEIISVIDGLGNQTHFAYDLCHRLTRIIQSEQGHFDAAEINSFNRSQKDIRITDYCYDKNGNVVETIDPEGNLTQYTYDGNNRILTQTDADGYKVRCEYYPDGTVKSYDFADGKSIKLSYNPLKQLVQMTDWLGITKIQPDKMGRPTQVTTPEDKTISYEWGERGECRSIVYSDGFKALYEYDEALRLSQCNIGEDKISYGYYPNGKIKEKRLPDSVKANYQYNMAGYISEISYTKGNNLIDVLNYQYDRNNRKSRISRTRPGMEDNGVYEYRYNQVGSLISVNKNGSEEERYCYDGYGNRTFSRVRGKETNYVYNRLNQLIRKSDEEGEHIYSYDHRGNLLLEQVDGTAVRKAVFNAQGLLECVRHAGKTVSYQYNGFGNRVKRHVESEHSASLESGYLYDITKKYNHLLSIEDEHGARNVIWDGGVLACMGMEGSRYFLNDERMSPLRILQGGNICKSMSFDSFGNVIEDIGTGVETFGYAGYHPDPVSGFMHVNARDYDAKSGRFISRDLFPGMVTLPLTLNAYAYAVGDPINRYDPTGMIFAWLGAGIVGAVVNVVTKVAGDVVESVSTGKLHVSSWQSYLGTATGGFTYGAVFVGTGGNKALAGAASSVVETFTSDGLSMLTGAEGYRAEDGYSWKNLLGNTLSSAATGASMGYLFDQAGEWVRIPGINKGRGSFQAVWKQVMTKASQGQIANITMKTLGKGIVAYGGVHLVDQILQKGRKKGKELVSNWITNIFNRNKGNAQCPAEG